MMNAGINNRGQTSTINKY